MGYTSYEGPRDQGETWACKRCRRQRNVGKGISHNDTPLTKALGTKEKPGRARGVGVSATWEKAFPIDPEVRRTKRKKTQIDEDMKKEMLAAARAAAKAEIADEVSRQVESRFKTLVSSLGISLGSLQSARVGHGSSEASASDIVMDATHPVNNITVRFDGLLNTRSKYSKMAVTTNMLSVLQGPTKCRLLYRVPGMKHTVATGRVYPIEAGATVHTTPLQPNMAKVQVDSVVEQWGEFAVPFPPEEDVLTLQGCVRYFIQWPKADIELEGTSHRSSPMTNISSQRSHTKPSPLGLRQPRLQVGEDEGDANDCPEMPQMDTPKLVVDKALITEKRTKRKNDQPVVEATKGLSPSTLQTALNDAMLQSKPKPLATPVVKKRKTKRGGTAEKNKRAKALKESTAKSLSFSTPKEPKATKYIKGDPLLPEHELQRIGREAKLLNDTYMLHCSDKTKYVNFFRVVVPLKYGFFREYGCEYYDIGFPELWFLFNFEWLDMSIIRTWTLYLAKEANRLGAKVGFIDPCLTNWHTLREDECPKSARRIHCCYMGQTQGSRLHTGALQPTVSSKLRYISFLDTYLFQALYSCDLTSTFVPYIQRSLGPYSHRHRVEQSFLL